MQVIEEKKGTIVSWPGENGKNRSILFDGNSCGMPKEMRVESENLLCSSTPADFQVELVEGGIFTSQRSQIRSFDFRANDRMATIHTEIKPKFVAESGGIVLRNFLWDIDWYVRDGSDEVEGRIKLKWRPPRVLVVGRISCKLGFNFDQIDRLSLSYGQSPTKFIQFHDVHFGNCMEAYGYTMPKWIRVHSCQHNGALAYLHFPSGISGLGKHSSYEFRANDKEKYLRIDFVRPGSNVTYCSYNPRNTIRFVLHLGTRNTNLNNITRQFVWTWPEGEWVYGVGHLHSTYSDGHNSLLEIAEMATSPMWQSEFVIMTDHEIRPTPTMDFKIVKQYKKKYSFCWKKKWEEYKKECALLNNPLFVFRGQKETSVRFNQSGWPPTGPYRDLHDMHVVIYEDEDLILPFTEKYRCFLSRIHIMGYEEYISFAKAIAEEILNVSVMKELLDKRGAIAFLAHPQHFPRDKPTSYQDMKGLYGMEIWWKGSLFLEASRYAREDWDSHLKRGLRLYGMGATDYHRLIDSPHGPTWIGNYLYTHELTWKGVIEAMKKGHFYVGSKLSPTIDHFSLNLNEKEETHIMMGDIIYVVGEAHVTVKVKSSCLFEKLKKIKLVKNGNVVTNINFNGGKASLAYDDRIASYTYFRTEIYTKNEKWGGAFSNPIFIYPKINGPKDCWLITHEILKMAKYNSAENKWILKLEKFRATEQGIVRIKCPRRPNLILCDGIPVEGTKWIAGQGIVQLSIQKTTTIQLFF